ncbi:hypothetical protein WME99_06945 [Sorangium sp. So ce136]|uniref:hypothetical protein n=1 Tax=Sorangium sp. So ce136 TaxID=3133284 RepID=UPI003F11E6D8
MATKTFDFEFTTLAQDSGQTLTNILFVDDAPADIDGLDVEAAAVAGITITLNVVGDKQVSASNYHVKLTFDPGELAQPEKIALDESLGGSWGMLCVHEAPDAAGAHEERAPGDVHLYFLYKGDTPRAVTATDPLRLKLLKVGASSRGGTRPTIVSLSLNKQEPAVDKFVMVAGGPGDQLTESVRLSLLAPRIQAAPTLMAAFASSDIILNDGRTGNGLVLRIVNTGLLPIPLSPEGSPNPSRFTLRFEASEQTADLWALGTASLVGQILIPAKEEKGSWVTDPNWSGNATWTVAHTAGAATWTLTPKAGKTALAPGEALEVPIGKVVTGHATGRTPLRIGYGGLTGFSDGELVAFIQKYPLIFAGQQVGVGTRSPVDDAKLTLQTNSAGFGLLHTAGTVKLVTAVSDSPLVGSWAALGTITEHNLGFWANGSPLMVLKVDGKLGLCTLNPSETLTVATDPEATTYGITHTDGTVKLSTRILKFSPAEGGHGGGVGTQSNHPLLFYTNGSNPQMTLTKEGKLGIGTTEPSTKLTVHTGHYDGITHTNGTVELATRVTDDAGRLGTLGDHHLRFFTGGNDRMTLTAEGKVGIRTTSPSETLTVQTGDKSFGITHTNGTIELSTYVGYGRAGLETKNNYPLFFSTNSGPPQLLIATNGNVGIGTETPGAKLDVNGTLNVRGELKINGRKPIEYKTYEGSSSTAYVAITTYKHDEWIAVVAGFYVKGNSGDDIDWLYVNAAPENGVWTIRADTSEGDSRGFRVDVIFIRRELVS